MSQQLAIVVMIDVAAAIAAGKLDGNAYLIDNNKWAGSTGEGTGSLVSAIDATRVHAHVDAQVMNWLAFAIGTPPPTVPKSFFVGASKASPHRKLGGRVSEAHAAAVKIVDVTGAVVDTDGSGEAHVHTPVITSITGEAVDKGVMFPGEYGSPDPISGGLYWSATVNPNRVGLFAYTMHITLFHRSSDDAGKTTWKSVSMTCDSRLNVTRDEVRNGFWNAPALLPVF